MSKQSREVAGADPIEIQTIRRAFPYYSLYTFGSHWSRLRHCASALSAEKDPFVSAIPPDSLRVCRPSMPFATPSASGESEPLLRGARDDKPVGRSKYRYAIALAAAAGALGVFARADPLNVLATMRQGSARVYDNPANWLPNWGANIAPTPGIENTPATFVVRTFCKSEALKKNYADFWLDGEKEAYVVRHDYGSKSFFDSGEGIKMERVMLNETSGERGYRIETDAIDFEYGFAMKNLETGAWLYEIG